MRILVAVLAVCLATPAAADRASNFSATLVGADGDKLGIVTIHDSVDGWSMKVRPAPAADSVLIPLPFIPASHGDYFVFVGPGRKRIAWIMTGSVNGVPAAGDTVVWIYKVSDGAVATTTFAQLFTDADRDAVSLSTSGASWYPLTTMVKPKGARLTLPAAGGGSVVIDLKTGTAKRKRK
jgi:hypothetical protein